MPFCLICGKEGALSCTGCKIAKYCSKECQKSDWNTHRTNCVNANVLKLTEGDTRDATWKIASYLGRTLDSLNEDDVKGIEELADRKMFLYTAPMPDLRKHCVKAVLVCTNMRPPQSLGKASKMASPKLYFEPTKKESNTATPKVVFDLSRKR